ncbi:MAG: hypothetical protein ACRD21_03445, partial [Vicinamibacteria bacterium]
LREEGLSGLAAGGTGAKDASAGRPVLLPELEELDYETELMREIPFPIGPTVQGQGFWFRRK